MSSFPSKNGNLVEGEFLFTNEDFQQIAQILHSHAGIALAEGKAALVYSRLAKRLRSLGLRSFREYCALVEDVREVDERQAMMAALTTNVTLYFREPHHSTTCATWSCPLVDRARKGGKIRLWSAACSNGQEPYSMAITVLSALPEAANLDVKILATDIDPNMVAEGKAGIYREDAVAPVPVELRRRWLKKPTSGGQDSRWEVADELRALVAFRELNLIGDWPMKGKFDAIFCRNVVIYFDEPTQERIWSRFAPMLNPGGTLYIGHSERVTGAATNIFETTGLTTYSLRSGR